MQTTPSPLFISPNEMLSEEALLQSLNAPNYNAQSTTTNDHHHSTSSSSNFVQSPIASLLQANPYLLAQQQQLFPPSQPRKRYAYTFRQILELKDHPVSRTMPPEIANLEIAITFASVPAHGYPPRERRDKFGASSMSAPSSSSPTNGPLSSLSSHSSRSRGNSGATARGSLLSSPDGTSIRRSGGSERPPSKKSHFFNQSKDYDSSNSASMSASAASSLPGGIGRERTRKISSANSSSLPLDPLAPRSAPKQAAWFNEKVTKAGDSLEPNPEELTQSERDRRDAFEEFRKQHIKNRTEEEDAFGGQGGLPSFFSDSNAGGATSLTLEDEADSLESSNVQVGAMSRFSSLMNQDSNTGTKGSLTTGFMDLHLGSTDEDVIDDDVDSDSMMKPFSRRGGHEGSRGGSKFFNPSSTQNDRDQNNTSNRDASQSDTASIQPRIGGSRFINTSMSHGELSHPVLDEAQMMKDFVLSPTGFSPIPDMFMHGGVPPSRLPYPYPDMHRAGPTGSPHMDMMDASRLESELMGGNRPRDSAAHAANVDALHNVFAQMQQPQPPMVGGPAMPNRILTQHPPQQMGAQSMAPFMNGPAVVQQHNQQQFITPYQQYVQAQAMKKNQQPQQPPKQTTSTTTATKQSPQEEQKDTPTKSKAVKQTRSQFVPSQISKSIGKAIKPKKPTGNVTSSPSGSSTSSGTPPASNTTASTSTSAPMTQGSSPPAISPTNQPPLNVQLPQHPQHMPNQPMFVQPQRGMMMPPHGMGKMSGPMPHLQAQQFGPMSPTFMMQQSPNFIPQQQMYNNPNMQQWFPAAFMGQGPMPTMMPMGSMSGEVMSLEDLEKNLTPVNK